MQGHAYTTDTVEKPLLLPLAPSPSPLQRRNTSSSAIPIKSSPLGIPRVQLQRSYSTSQSKSPIDGRSTGLNTAVVDPVPCPPRSSVEEQRAESLAKLTRSQMSSPISFSPSSFSAAYLSSDDGFTSASALADQSSLASSGTAVGAMTPRPHITIVSREHGTLLRSASNFLHKELGEAALGRRPARQPLGGFMLPADNTAHRLWVALHDGVLLLKCPIFLLMFSREP